MALQNFYMTGTNYKRATPVTLSGKEIKANFFMKVKGSSKNVVTIYGLEGDEPGEKDMIMLKVIVRDPNTEEIVCDIPLWCKKK